MEFLDARRLTGPSVLFDRHGAILDVACTVEEAERLIPVWKKHVQRMLTELGWQDCEFASVMLDGGISMAYTAPVDALYAASEINEWAWAACDHELNGSDEPDFAESVSAIRDSIAEEANPGLIRLEALAAEHGVTFLWDDDEASLGLGCHSETWPVRELPDPESLDWAATLGSTRAVIEGVLAGLGVAFLSHNTVAREIADGTLEEIPVREVDIKRGLYVVRHRQRTLSPVASCFLEELLRTGPGITTGVKRS